MQAADPGTTLEADRWRHCDSCWRYRSQRGPGRWFAGQLAVVEYDRAARSISDRHPGGCLELDGQPAAIAARCHIHVST